MSRLFKIGLTTAALAVVITACGGGADVSNDDGVGDAPAIAGVCAPDQPDCVDTIVVNDDEPSGSDDPLFLDDEPTDGVSPRQPSGFLVDGGLTIPEALTTDAASVLAVKGFYVADSTGVRLCELLAESYPPQCGGESIVVHDLETTDLGIVQNANGVTWTDDVVTVFGEITDGALVVSANVSG